MTEEFAVRTPDGVRKVKPHHFYGLKLIDCTTISKGGESRELKAGVFIWVNPENVHPDDTRDKEENLNELRLIESVFRHDRRKTCMLECRVYLQASKLDEAGPFDGMHLNMTRLLQSCGGAQDRRAHLNPTTVGFPTLFPDQPFTRTDIELGKRVTDGEHCMYASRAALAVCKPRCDLQRIYAPHIHEMRWCTSCQRWYHVDCMQSVGTGRESFTHEGNGNDESYSLRMWHYISLVRIARVPRRNEFHLGVPYTIETTIHALWTDMEGHDASTVSSLPEFPWHLATLIEGDPRSRGDQLRMWKELKELIPQTLEQTWYACPGYKCEELV